MSRTRRKLVGFRTLGAPKGSTRVIAYHGTSSVFLPSIMKHGLQAFPERKVWEDDPSASVYHSSRASYGGVYLTTNLLTATGSALAAVMKFGGRQLIIIASVKLGAVAPDEDNIVYKFEKQLASILKAEGVPVSGSDYWNEVAGYLDALEIFAEEPNLIGSLAAQRLDQIVGRFITTAHEAFSRHPVKQPIPTELWRRFLWIAIWRRNSYSSSMYEYHNRRRQYQDGLDSAYFNLNRALPRTALIPIKIVVEIASGTFTPQIQQELIQNLEKALEIAPEIEFKNPDLIINLLKALREGVADPEVLGPQLEALNEEFVLKIEELLFQLSEMNREMENLLWSDFRITKPMASGEAEEQFASTAEQLIHYYGIDVEEYEDILEKRGLASFRLMHNLGFSGSNRIIAIVEIIRNPTNYRASLARLYGELPVEFLDDWTLRQGEPEEIF